MMRLLLLAVAFPAAIAAENSELLEFSEWLQSTTVAIPAGIVFTLPALGALELTSGECKNMTVGSLSAIDNSVGLNLEIGLSVSGFGVSCTLNAEQNGTLAIDLTVVNSSFAFAVKLDPWYSPEHPQLPLPLSGPLLSQCSLDLQVSHAAFSGTSPGAQLAGSLPPATLRQLMGQFVQDPVCELVATMVSVNGSSAFATGRTILRGMLAPVEPLPAPRALAPTLDWGTWPPVLVVQDLISTEFPVWAGNYLQVMNLPMGQTLLSEASVDLSLAQMRVLGKTGMNHSGIHLAANGSNLGLAANLSSLEFQPTLGLAVHRANGASFRQEWQVSFGLKDFNIGGRLYVDRERMLEAQGENKFYHPSCMVDCARGTTDPAEGAVEVSQMDLTLEGGTNIRVLGDDQLIMNGTRAINRIIAALQEGYLDSINALVNSGLGLALATINQRVWSEIDHLKPCEAGLTGTHPGELTALWATSVSCTAVGILAGVICQLACGRRRKGKRASDGSNVGSSDLESSSEGSSSGDSTSSVDAGADAGSADVCLAMKPAVPMWLTVSYPMFLLGLAMLFVYADINLGAIVNVRTYAGGKQEVLGPLYSMSMVNTVDSAKKAGAWTIAIMTLLMSGLWPLVKLALLAACWLVPPRRLPVDRRGFILRILDGCGKYSFLDSWFLVLSMSAFAISWSGTSTSFQVEVIPMPAFYCFLMATFFSLFLGHVASEFHRHDIRKEWRFELMRSGAGSGSSTELAAVDGARAATTVEESAPLCSLATRRQRWLVGGSLAATLVLAFVAAFMVSFTAEVHGLVGEVLKIKDQHYSLVGLGAAIPTSSASGHGSELTFLAALFFLLTLILPLLLLALLLVLWLLPLPRRAQDVLLYASYLMDCWSSMEVAVLILTIEAMDLGYFTEFILRVNGADKVCHLIKDITHSECVNISIRMQPGFVLLLLAGVALVVVPKVAFYYCKQTNNRKLVAKVAKLGSLSTLGSFGSSEGGGTSASASAARLGSLGSSQSMGSAAEAGKNAEPADRRL